MTDKSNKLGYILIGLIVINILIAGKLILSAKSAQITKIETPTISPVITPSINEILISKFPELQISGNTIHLKGERSEDFVIYINPKFRIGLEQSDIGMGEDIEINDTEYKKYLNYYIDSKKVDILFTQKDDINGINLEIVANDEKILSSTKYGIEIIKILQNQTNPAKKVESNQ